MGNTADKQLFASARRGDIGGIRESIKQGARVTGHAEPHGWTPLHAAAVYNKEMACRLLINAKADMMARDKAGKSPLEACKERHPELHRKLDAIMNGATEEQYADENFEDLDKDSDGRLTRGELSGELQQNFEEFDANGDGALDKEEYDTAFKVETPVVRQDAVEAEQEDPRDHSPAEERDDAASPTTQASSLMELEGEEHEYSVPLDGDSVPLDGDDAKEAAPETALGQPETAAKADSEAVEGNGANDEKEVPAKEAT